MRNPLNIFRGTKQPEKGTISSTAASRAGVLQAAILIALAGVTSCAKTPDDNLKPAPKPGTRVPLEGIDGDVIKPNDPPYKRQGSRIDQFLDSIEDLPLEEQKKKMDEFLQKQREIMEKNGKVPKTNPAPPATKKPAPLFPDFPEFPDTGRGWYYPPSPLEESAMSPKEKKFFDDVKKLPLNEQLKAIEKHIEEQEEAIRKKAKEKEVENDIRTV